MDSSLIEHVFFFAVVFLLVPGLVVFATIMRNSVRPAGPHEGIERHEL